MQDINQQFSTVSGSSMVASESKIFRQAPVEQRQFQPHGLAVGLLSDRVKQLALTAPAQRFKIRGDQGFVAWSSDINNRLAVLELFDTASSPPPTFEQARMAFPDLTGYALYDMYEAAVAEYNEENTCVFHIVMATIDLTGPRHDNDTRFIMRNFHHGQLRDGRGLINWIQSLADTSDVGAQDKLQNKMGAMKLSPTANLEQLEKHCISVLDIWEQISGNDVSNPSTYNTRLLNSIPAAGCSPSVVAVRVWLADKITDQPSYVNDPQLLIDRLLKYAETVGIQQSQQGSLFFMGQNDCKVCDAWGCTSTRKGGPQHCLIMNDKTDLSGLRPGQQAYVKDGRAYVAAHPGCKSVKGVKFRMPAAAAPASAATGGSVVNTVGAAADAGEVQAETVSIEDYAAALERHRAGESLSSDGAVIKIATSRGVNTIGASASESQPNFDAWWDRLGDGGASTVNIVNMISAGSKTGAGGKEPRTPSTPLRTIRARCAMGEAAEHPSGGGAPNPVLAEPPGAGWLALQHVPLLQQAAAKLVTLVQAMHYKDKILGVAFVVLLVRRRAALYRKLIELILPLQARARSGFSRILLLLASTAARAANRVTYNPKQLVTVDGTA